MCDSPRTRCTWKTTPAYTVCVSRRDDHYPVFRLDIRQDSQFATGYGYPKTAFKREPDTDLDTRNVLINISWIQTFGKFAHCAIIHLLFLKASFQPSLPWLRVCLWCNLCTVECSLISFPLLICLSNTPNLLTWICSWCRKVGLVQSTLRTLFAAYLH